jgi:hypothetical protein
MVACITGRNEVAKEKLEHRYGDNERVRILGFTEQMSDWMAAADAMVHSTGGLTVLEAHIRGCPVVSFGFSAGHLRANNAAFERFGLAEVARSEHELESVLRHLSRERRSPDSSFASLPSIASRTLAVRPRARPQPVWRLRAGRAAAAVSAAAAAIALVVGVSLAGDWETPYHVLSKAAKPLEGRIHFGRDPDTSPAAIQRARPARATTAARHRAAEKRR